MVEPKEVAYNSEGPRVVLRRMKQAGLSTIFVVDGERRLVGICEAEEVARATEREESDLGGAINRNPPKVQRGTPLRQVLPLFVDQDLPVAVTNDRERLEGVVVRGSLIAGLTTSVDFGEDSEDIESTEVRQASKVGQNVQGGESL